MAYCIEKLHRLPGEVERDNPDLTEADLYRCFALSELQAEAMKAD